MHSCVQEVSGLKCDQLLSSGQVLPSECVSGLVELTGNPNTSPALASAIISLLSQLGRVSPFAQCVLVPPLITVSVSPITYVSLTSAGDDDGRKMLHSSYNLTSTLASVIHCHSATPGEPLVLQVSHCPIYFIIWLI